MIDSFSAWSIVFNHDLIKKVYASNQKTNSKTQTMSINKPKLQFARTQTIYVYLSIQVFSHRRSQSFVQINLFNLTRPFTELVIKYFWRRTFRNNSSSNVEVEISVAPSFGRTINLFWNFCCLVYSLQVNIFERWLNYP